MRLHLKILEDGTLTLSPTHQNYLSKFHGKDFVGEVEKSKRSLAQNNALHLWFKLIADEFNNAGYSVQLILKQKIDLDWDADKVKELLWRPAQRALLGKKSTTELKKIEDIDIVWEHLNRHLGEKFGIHADFPNQEQLEKIDPTFTAN